MLKSIIYTHIITLILLIYCTAVTAQTTTFFVDAKYSARMVSGYPHTSFQDTGVYIKYGDSISITSSGSACYSSGCTGAEGGSYIPSDSSYLAPGFPFSSLVGKIGSGSLFLLEPPTPSRQKLQGYYI